MCIHCVTDHHTEPTPAESLLSCTLHHYPLAQLSVSEGRCPPPLANSRPPRPAMRWRGWKSRVSRQLESRVRRIFPRGPGHPLGGGGGTPVPAATDGPPPRRRRRRAEGMGAGRGAGPAPGRWARATLTSAHPAGAPRPRRPPPSPIGSPRRTAPAPIGRRRPRRGPGRGHVNKA